MVGPIDDGLTSAIHGVRWRCVGRRAGNARPTSDPDPLSPGSRLANEPRYMSFGQCGPCPAIARRHATMENVVRTPARWYDADAGNRGATIRLSHLPHAARHARCLDRSPPRPSSDDGSIPAASALGSARQAPPSSCISSPSKGSSRRTPPSTSIQHRWAASSSNGREARRERSRDDAQGRFYTLVGRPDGTMVETARSAPVYRHDGVAGYRSIIV